VFTDSVDVYTELYLKDTAGFFNVRRRRRDQKIQSDSRSVVVVHTQIQIPDRNKYNASYMAMFIRIACCSVQCQLLLSEVHITAC